mmetsp:Transcript_36764/g.118268  ORF Transcript_36764/g.118268 Transcript_36764/m.118268 type:complete len:93 (+) Transcript_36764:2137-2415(+)
MWPRGCLPSIALPPGASIHGRWRGGSTPRTKKRNRLSQRTVERLVRSHTNLLLEARFNSEAGPVVLPWEVMMEIEEPESGEEAGEEADSDSD